MIHTNILFLLRKQTLLGIFKNQIFDSTQLQTKSHVIHEAKGKPHNFKGY